MKRAIHLLIAVVALLCMTSCYNTKRTGKVWLYKRQSIYRQVTTPGKPPRTRIDSLYLPNGGIAKLGDKTGHLRISLLNGTTTSPAVTLVPDTNPSRVYKYFPLESDHQFKTKLKYMEQAPIFQAVSIPFKLRPKANDSIPYQLSTSANAGFAVGWEFTHKVYGNIYDGSAFLKSRTRQFSFAPAVFIGPTTVGLKNENTNNRVGKDRTVMGLNAGGMLVFGIDKFNIGLATGCDIGLGSPSKNWIYQGKPWFGLVVGIEFIK